MSTPWGALERRRQRSSRRDQNGLSLVEIVLALAMLMILMVGLYKSLGAARTSANALQEMAQQESDSRRATDQLISDLRMSWTGDQALGRLATPVSGSIKECSITFYSPNRDANAKLRWITYKTVGTDLLRSETLSTGVIRTTPNAGGTLWDFPATQSPFLAVLHGVRQVNNLGCAANDAMFSYLDASNNVLAAPTAATVKRVQIRLTIDRIVGKFPDPDTFSTSVEFRSK